MCRHLRGHDFVSLEEFTPERGKRLDVMALGPKGELWVIECKSSRVDFTSDAKWTGYLEWGEPLFLGGGRGLSDPSFLPQDTGLIIADAYDAEILRMGAEAKLPPARRRAVTQRFARHAALRLQGLRDPGLIL